MTVAMIDSSGLDEMEATAKNLFSGIRNKNIPERIWPSRPFKNSQVSESIIMFANAQKDSD